MLKNSIRQMLRTPVRTVLFCLLAAACGGLVVLGLDLLHVSRNTQAEAEKAFVTLGMVEQKPDSQAMVEEWDPRSQAYVQYSKKKYDKILPDALLDIEGLPYIYKPKHQPYYVAYTGNYVVRNTHSEVDESWLGMEGKVMVAEVEILEDCVPDHPVQVQVKKSLYGKRSEKNTGKIWYWDYDNPKPNRLYAGKTYVMAIYAGPEVEYLVDRAEDLERYAYAKGEIWLPWTDNGGRQYNKEGEKLTEEGFDASHYSLITEDFYQTDVGKRWRNLVRGFEMLDYSIPVVPTDDTRLLMYFHEGNAQLVEGRDITEEEYGTGEKVCLLEQEFAQNNQYKVGDRIRFPLYCADYRWAACRHYTKGLQSTSLEALINANGELYEPFEDSEYEIVGIYRAVQSGSSTGFDAPKNGVIIPSSSVRNNDEEHIVDYGWMRPENTVFQIENGSVEEFIEIWSKKGTDQLEITFSSNGYEELEQSFQNMRRMSILLLGVGAGLAALLLFFFSYLFVVKQKERIALERSLGMTKRQCRISVLSGILLVVLVGGILGCTIGAVLAEKISNTDQMNWLIPSCIVMVLLSVTWFLAGAMIGQILQKEPIELLADMKREI